MAKTKEYNKNKPDFISHYGGDQVIKYPPCEVEGNIASQTIESFVKCCDVLEKSENTNDKHSPYYPYKSIYRSGLCKMAKKYPKMKLGTFNMLYADKMNDTLKDKTWNEGYDSFKKNPKAHRFMISTGLGENAHRLSSFSV